VRYDIGKGWFKFRWVGRPQIHHLHWRIEAQASYAHQVPSGSRLPTFDNEEEQTPVKYDIGKGVLFSVGSGDPYGIAHIDEKKSDCIMHIKFPVVPDFGRFLDISKRLRGTGGRTW
jgi:hypothetical protein